ncbi:MAG: transglycosylase domain-containing protein [Candidatus Limnocylindrales bacterium]
MRNSLARRQRHRRQGARHRPRGVGVVRSTLVALPIIIFGILVVVGLGAGVAAVSAYQYLAQGLPDPTTLDTITFTSQTVVYDRTGKVQLAKLGSDRRDVVQYKDVPPALIDATTAAEDKTFWENAGFDPVAFVKATIDTLQGNDRGASTITQQLVRARLLPQDVLDGNIYIRKAKEIIQSIRLTQAYPGVTGKQTIMQDYLNQNYYGNRSYGVAAAAKSYWNKDLKDLTLAQMALLAGIPKSPTQYDLVKNAVEQSVTGANGKATMELVVPASSAIVQRRNYILDLMLTQSSLGTYTQAQIEAAKAEPVILASQATPQWLAPQFVWQVRDELGQLLCGTPQCQKIDTGGYTVYTTLNYSMQQTVEKWAYAAAVIPNLSNQTAALKAKKIPSSEWGWIRNLTGQNVHNDAAGVVDYRTGEVLAYVGSADYLGKGNKKFQPQFDVLGDGFRQSGSSIKPIDYAVGIDDKTMTASTLFMDVVTNFAAPGQTPFLPTQADSLERGPVRLRSALEFSLNVPAIKAGFINGLDHQLQRSKDFGLVYPPNTYPVASESIGTLLVHPIDMISAFGALADGGVLMPRHTILKVIGPDGEQVWPQPGVTLAGKRVVSKQAAYIITDILAGNTQMSVNPFWGKWRVTDGVTSSKVRPAAYKTGTTSDNRDVLADGYLPPPSDPKLPGLVVGVWMGNSDNSPNSGRLSLDSSAPLWSAIMSEISKGMPIESFSRTKPAGLVTATIDAFTGMKPGPTTRKTITEMYLPGTQPTGPAKVTVTADIDAATGLLWQPGCAGPMQTRSFIDFSQVEAGFPAWQKADIAWQARAARGPGVVGGPKHTATSYFYGQGFFPFGASWGGSFAPTKKCTVVPVTPPPPTPCISLDPLSPCPSAPPPSPIPVPKPS